MNSEALQVEDFDFRVPNYDGSDEKRLTITSIAKRLKTAETAAIESSNLGANDVQVLNTAIRLTKTAKGSNEFAGNTDDWKSTQEMLPTPSVDKISSEMLALKLKTSEPLIRISKETMEYISSHTALQFEMMSVEGLKEVSPEVANYNFQQITLTGYDADNNTSLVLIDIKTIIYSVNFRQKKTLDLDIKELDVVETSIELIDPIPQVRQTYYLRSGIPTDRRDEWMKKFKKNADAKNAASIKVEM